MRQSIGLFEPVLRVKYTVFDFGERSGRIIAARQQLIAANFAFNPLHLSILFETSRRYYHLLNEQGQQEAAALNLQNAQTVSRALDARVQVGLSTLPDAFEARAAIRHSPGPCSLPTDAQLSGRRRRSPSVRQAEPSARYLRRPIEVWNTSLNLRWILFDGGKREAELARSHAKERQARAEIDRTRDDVEQQVWVTYVDLQTSFRQRRAAATLLEAARTSYDVTLKSYTFGLRNTVDIVTAQRTLARALSTSLATCVITALSSVGSSRQKQILRLTGAAVGGLVFGISSQVFILPSLDTIVGFTFLFVVVT